MPGAINGYSNAATPNFYADVDRIVAEKCQKAGIIPDASAKSEKSDEFVSSTQKEAPEQQVETKNKPENNNDGKWGILKTAAVLATVVAAVKTGNALELKGKNLKEIAKTVFNKNTVINFCKNLNPLQWFGAAKVEIAQKPGFLNTAEDLIAKRFAK